MGDEWHVDGSALAERTHAQVHLVAAKAGWIRSKTSLHARLLHVYACSGTSVLLLRHSSSRSCSRILPGMEPWGHQNHTRQPSFERSEAFKRPWWVPEGTWIPKTSAMVLRGFSFRSCPLDSKMCMPGLPVTSSGNTSSHKSG